MNINQNAEGMMEALGISQERCEELCNAIEDTWNQHRDWTFGRVLEDARVNHCRTDEEFAFVCHIFGQHQGFQHGAAMGQAHSNLQRLFGHLSLGAKHVWEEHEPSHN